MTGNKILLTGASGFLGSALARNFRANGHDVFLLLRSASSRRRLQGHEFVIGYCDSEHETREFVQRVAPDVVVHTACSYGRKGESLIQLIDTNVRFGLIVLDAMRGLARLDQPRLFLNTNTSLSADVSPYAMSKQQFAQWGRREALSAPTSLRFVNVRLEHMYGPGDDLTKFPTHVLHACHRNDLQLKLTAGEQIRDFIYVDDVISAYAKLLNNAHDFGPTLDIELGSGKAVRVRDFVEMAHALTSSRTELLFGALPYRAAEAMRSVANIDPILGIGWRPAFDLSSGLKKMIELEF